MFIQTENTPNPETVKFLPGETVMEAGVFAFTTPEEIKKSPLASRLFEVDGVAGLFYGSDFISVTKDSAVPWELMKPCIMAVIMEHYSIGEPLFTESITTEEAGEEDEISAQIRELIETRVRPMVAQDGGDIVFVKFDKGIAYMQMRGACAGCPSSAMTLKSGIENMLRHYVPEVLEVRQLEA